MRSGHRLLSVERHGCESSAMPNPQKHRGSHVTKGRGPTLVPTPGMKAPAPVQRLCVSVSLCLCGETCTGCGTPCDWCVIRHSRPQDSPQGHEDAEKIDCAIVA